MPAEPRWERGRRCHGFWLGKERIGLISYGTGKGAAKAGGYDWSFALPPITDDGWSLDLKAAKRRIEKLYAEWKAKKDAAEFAKRLRSKR